MNAPTQSPILYGNDDRPACPYTTKIIDNPLAMSIHSIRLFALIIFKKPQKN